MERKFTELEIVRREKLNKLKEMGINPFSKKVDFTHSSKKLNEEFNNFTKEDLETKKIKVSSIGRIWALRIPFVELKDSFGHIQGYISKDNAKLVSIIEQLDMGDIVRFEGTVMKTKTGELAIRVETIDVNTKSLKPLPNKWEGLKDIEERYRRRYVDLLINEEAKQIFWTRTKAVSAIREYFDNLGYMEADTPILHGILGGAAAKPFTTHFNALHQDFYLRIATEIPLKKLLVGGIDRVYEIGRIFRNEGIDTTHNPEFTSIEFYEAYSNLDGMIKRTEEVFAFVAKKVGKEKIIYNGKEISLKAPFARINMVDAVNKASGYDFRNMSLDEAKKIATEKYKVKVESYFGIGHIINELFEILIEETLIQPTFVTGHPIEISPLAAVNEQDPRFTDRAELFIDGREYANMFTELNDPIDQLGRFEDQLKEREAGNDEANEIDMDFVEALEYGMPPAGGCGIGIDRLVMLLTEKESIREVLLFPHLKEKEQN